MTRSTPARARRAFAALAACGLLVLAAVGCKEATLGPEQFGSLEGQVIDFETGLALANVGVTTAPPSSALVTDGEGRFLFEDLPAGSYTITANRTGYQPNTVTVSVRENETTQATLFLREEEDEPGDTTNAAIDVEVLNFVNEIEGDSTRVHTQYRVRNIGNVDIPAYEVYFRIETTGATFFQEQQGTELGVSQFDIEEFDRYLYDATATAVVVDTFWFAGQDSLGNVKSYGERRAY